MGRSSSVEEIAMAQSIRGRERRKQHRFDCAGPAEVVSLNAISLCHGQIKDLSLTGCYVLTGATRLDLQRRADVKLYLSVNGDHLDTPARLVAVRPESGAAFEFLAVDPEMRGTLLTLIGKLTAQSSA